jgi:hypothetical protein
VRFRAVEAPVWLFSLAALVRLGYLFAVRPAFETDYWDISTSLIHDGSIAIDGIRTTDYEPLYPVFLAVTRVLSGDHVLVVQVIQSATASLGAVYLYRLASALTNRWQVAAIAASLYALDPLLIRQAAQPADSALVTPLIVAFAYYFVTAADAVGMALAGVVLGVVVLTRATGLPLVLFAGALLLAERRFQPALALTLAVVVLVLPFVLRNRSVNGSLWPTRSGLNLYIGNSPFTSALLPDYDVDILGEPAAMLIGGQLSQLSSGSPEYSRAADALFSRLAVDYMARRPLDTLRQKALNVMYFFSPRLVPLYVAVPETRAVVRSGHVVVEHARRRPPIEVVSYSTFYAPVLVMALAGITLRRRELSRDGVLWCSLLSFTAIHALYFPATRYRAPVEFVLLFYAAVALHRLVSGYRTLAAGPVTLVGARLISAARDDWYRGVFRERGVGERPSAQGEDRAVR